MRLLLTSVISLSFAACNSGLPATGPVGSAAARITQVPSMVGCVAITAAGDRTVTDTFDVTPGQSATLRMSDLPVGNIAFSAAAFGSGCGAIAGAQPSWSTSAPFFAPIAVGTVTALTLTLEPTGGATIGIDFDGDGGDPIDGGFPIDGGDPIDGGGPIDMAPWFGDGGNGGADLAYTPVDLAHP